MRPPINLAAHGLVDSCNIAEYLTVVRFHPVSQKGVVAYFLRLMFADKLADYFGQSVSLSLRDKLCRINTLRQKANVIQVKLALTNVEALLPFVIDNQFQIIGFIMLQHLGGFIDGAILVQHQRHPVDFLNIPIDGAAFRRNGALFQIGYNVHSSCNMVFVGAAKKILQHHIGFDLLVRLLAVLGLFLNVFVYLPRHTCRPRFCLSFIRSCQKQREKGGIFPPYFGN